MQIHNTKINCKRVAKRFYKKKNVIETENLCKTVGGDQTPIVTFLFFNCVFVCAWRHFDLRSMYLSGIFNYSD